MKDDRLDRPDLVIGYMKKSKRQKAFPYVVGFAIGAIIILKAIKECM